MELVETQVHDGEEKNREGDMKTLKEMEKLRSGGVYLGGNPPERFHAVEEHGVPVALGRHARLTDTPEQLSDLTVPLPLHQLPGGPAVGSSGIQLEVLEQNTG